ncbi:hypothetical protein TTHT_1292 [Thermotomaculum hydrothermale]|uniref:Yip1 domain-containing protein n=1 Tax=Thermotomaculum hydrothermale TaxID=981385 RepID=A0A7R6PFJ3_9BACT|nr:YIP1 family protein [Thermotomaculum hydrothermale]BBB32809.1 hypothetical protein TTHT_1292 [Thermotomaculum hydrothermale]
MIKCPNCGFSLNGDEAKCPNCGYVLKKEETDSGEVMNQTPPPPSVPQTPPESTPSYSKMAIPFADSSLPFFDRLVSTVKLVLFSPREFFANYDFKAQIGAGILFALIMGFVSGIFSFIYNLVFRSSLYSMLAQWGNIPAKEMQMQSMFAVFGGVLGIFLIPIGVIIGLFIMAGIYHLLLMIVNGAKNGFESTVNVVAYTSAVMLFAIVPFCGGLLGWIYRIILNIMGLAEVHETTTGKATFAVLLPYIFCCLCFVIYIVAILGVVGMAAAGGGH